MAALHRFESDEEVLRLANDPLMGVQRTFSLMIILAYGGCESLKYEMVGVNTAAISNEVGPFGGIKHS